MKILAFYIVLFNSNIIAQNLNEEFKFLAEYAITKHRLEVYNYSSDWNSSPLGSLNSGMNYKFNIKEIFRINNIRIIEIEDLNNISPHSKYIFAVKPSGNFILQNELTFGKENDFINLILQDDSKIDKQYKQLCIKLYNLITSYYKNVEYLDDNNKGDFNILSDYRLEDYNKLYKSDGNYYYDSFYKIKDSDTLSFYFIQYIFSCNNFSVDIILLYKIKV